MATATPAAADRIAGEFPIDLDWSPGGRVASLSRLVQFVHNDAKASADWYFAKRKIKRRAGLFYRYTAMIGAALGAILPVCTQISQGTEWAWAFPPGLPAIALALAGVFVLLDRFAGHTTGWIRFIQTGQEITDRLEVFRFEDQMLRLAWVDATPDDAQLREHLQLCATLSADVRDMERKETQQWASEFRDALQQLDQAANSGPAEVQIGGIQVTVDNGADFPDGWTVTLNGGRAQTRTGTSVALPRLSPGQAVLEVSADDPAGGPRRRVSQLVQVTAGGVTPVTLSL